MATKKYFTNLKKSFIQLEQTLGINENDFVCDIHRKLTVQQASLLDNNIVNTQNMRQKFLNNQQQSQQQTHPSQHKQTQQQQQRQ